LPVDLAHDNARGTVAGRYETGELQTYASGQFRLSTPRHSIGRIREAPRYLSVWNFQRASRTSSPLADPECMMVRRPSQSHCDAPRPMTITTESLRRWLERPRFCRAPLAAPPAGRLGVDQSLGWLGHRFGLELPRRRRLSSSGAQSAGENVPTRDLPDGGPQTQPLVLLIRTCNCSIKSGGLTLYPDSAKPCEAARLSADKI
jgi:hypothetical protein